MTKQTIDIGTSPNKGDGDPIRVAFRKINDNFTELYDGNFVEPTSIGSSLIPANTATVDLGSEDRQWADLHVSDFIYLNGQRIEALSTGSLLINGSEVLEETVFGTGGIVSGNIIPDTDVEYDMGSADKRFRDLYLSGSTIDLGGTELSVVDGELRLGDVQIPTVTDLANGISINFTGDLQGSLFSDDSTLLVDSVNSKIVGDIETDSLTVSGTGLINFNNDAYNDTFYGGFTTDKAILSIQGADYLAGSNDGGGVTIRGGLARNGGNNGDVIISSGAGGAAGTGFISLLADYITTSGTWLGTQTMDIQGSVFGDDSTLLVDGVNGIVTGPLTGNWTSPGNYFTVSGAGLTVNSTTNSVLSISDFGLSFIHSENTDNISLSVNSNGFAVAGDGNVSIAMNNFAASLSNNVSVAVTNDIAITASGDFTLSANTIDFSGVLTANGIFTGTLTGDFKGSVFADDNTLLVDGENNKIVGSIDTNTIATSSGNLTITADNYVIIDSANNGQIEIGRSSGVGNVIIGNTANSTDVEIKGNILLASGLTFDFNNATVSNFKVGNNSGIAYQFGYSAHDAVSTAGNDFSINSSTVILSHVATSNSVQGARIDVSGVTSNTSAGSGLIYIQRRVNSGSWNVWSSFVVDGAGDHFNHSFVDFYDTGGTSVDVAAGDTVEYKLTNGTDNSNYSGNSSGTVDFELFFGFQFTATELPLSYSLIQP